MSEQKYSIERDLSEAQAMVKALVPYVYEKELYGRAGSTGSFGAGMMPALTLGAVLMRIRRLRALRDRLNPAQQAQLDNIEARNEEVRREWTTAYEGKLVKEATSRLDAMNAFFEECRESLRQCANVYLPEVLRRTIVEEIRYAMRDYGIESADVETKARGADSKLRRYVQPAPFLWSPEIETVYPKDNFWWMYNRPPKNGNER